MSVAAFAGVLVIFVERTIKSSQVYQLSLAKAQATNGVLEYIGQPFQEGWFVSGSLSESSDGTGHAFLSIPLSGPKGDGRLHADALRQAGNWTFRALQLEVVGKKPDIDLLSQ